MLDLGDLGREIKAARKAHGFTQRDLARLSEVSRATLDALENERAGELGYSKIAKILAVLGLELRIHAANRRPTLEDLIEENRNAQGLDRRL
jgi:transcriptional regulator with XRE-family HTH domain